MRKSLFVEGLLVGQQAPPWGRNGNFSWCPFRSASRTSWPHLRLAAPLCVPWSCRLVAVQWGKHRGRQVNWAARIRTWEWRDQNPLPYHLKTAPGQEPKISIHRLVAALETGGTPVRAMVLPPGGGAVGQTPRVSSQLGRQDSNLGMAGPKPAASPLGDHPRSGAKDQHPSPRGRT